MAWKHGAVKQQQPQRPSFLLSMVLTAVAVLVSWGCFVWTGRLHPPAAL